MVLERRRRWRPKPEMGAMEWLWEEGFPGWPFSRMWRRTPGQEMAWAPSVDMYEKEDSFVVRAQLPGVSKDDLDISLTGDTLTIKGERKAPSEVKGGEYHRCEVCYGPFTRSITLPYAVDRERIEATYPDGVLEIRLPKAKEVMATKIQIKAG